MTSQVQFIVPHPDDEGSTIIAYLPKAARVPRQRETIVLHPDWPFLLVTRLNLVIARALWQAYLSPMPKEKALGLKAAVAELMAARQTHND